MKWIDVNLPWLEYLDQAMQPNPPNLEAREREVFGTTRNEISDKMPSLESDLYDRLDSLIEEAMPDGTEWIEAESAVYESLGEGHPIKGIIDSRRLCRQINKWWSLQPEVARHEEAFRAFIKAENRLSFSRSDLCRPGVEIEVRRRNGDVKRMLIGDINRIGGVCDDCRDIENDDVVLKCRVVWEKGIP
jgi:hypothetical protein